MTDRSILIRPLTMDDAAEFNRVVGVVARERRYLRFIDSPPMAMTVDFLRAGLDAGNPHQAAVDGDKVIGWCDVRRHSFEVERHGGTLGIGLLPDYRGRGIGRRLIEAAIAAADARGFERIELTVLADNARAIRLYEATGFEREGLMRASSRFGDRDYRDVVLMARLGPALRGR